LPEIDLDDRVIVESGGFSFQPAVAYDTEVTDEAGFGLAFLSGEGDSIIINMIGVPDAEAILGGKSDLELLDELVADFVGNMNGAYELGESYAMRVGEAEGTAVDVSGILFDKPFIGQAVYSNPVGNQIFFAIALSRDSETWATTGASAFAAMVASVESLSVSGDSDNGDGATAVGPCPVSTDATYGYTEANPIQVGGDAFGGPPRERAYLDNLLGSNGETVTYEREGSIPFGDTFLDIYLVAYAGSSTTLYLDEYNWSEPQAPLGFTCVDTFPLTPP
jgi:hypothetical protein